MSEANRTPLDKAIDELMAMSEQDRTEYCIAVVMAVAGSFEAIAKNTSKIAQARMLKKTLADLKLKSNEILPVLMYIIKPEFRDTANTLIERFAGLF